MQHNIPKTGLFITGTNTDVGKTFITSLIASELITQKTPIGIYKPVCTGAEVDGAGNRQWGDVRRLATAMGAEDNLTLQNKICPQCFNQPAAPPVAATSQGMIVDSELLLTGLARWEGDVDIMLVEGVGGLLCPLTQTATIADFAKDVNYPLIIVVAVELGMINQTLLTVEVAQKRQLPIAGIVFNVISSNVTKEFIQSNLVEISSRTDIPILSIVEHNQSFDLRTTERQHRIDWKRLAMSESFERLNS